MEIIFYFTYKDKMEINELLEISSELRESIRTYISENADYGEVIAKRARDVTRKIDMFAERALEKALSSRGLCARIISEELGDHIFPKGNEPKFTLIFDPIDGSTNAILGIPFFCSSIAYLPKVEHLTFDDIQASVVATIQGRTYYAVKGGHAFVDGKKLPHKVKGKTKQVFSIYTYGADSIPEGLIEFQKQNKNVVIRVLGSIAMEICLVAEGVMDAAIDVRGLISGYDIAGAVLILNEAGGILTDAKGKKLREGVEETQNISLIAALEPEIHKRMLSLVV
uniref:fructose-bisphosphatase n=2 Tax=Methanomicrobia TaxID=224756 RepID=A0A7G9YCZ9_9EURY|nr:fructose-1,6-bisphosphatase/inositol-1-monophosphatase [Methanosarcinales archaeon ANME-2c ERB4]QNO53508.1 fructose-1,6-bisphosphatase/inositol-1-monophosphatase [Methanosarcinales archaeon ANME-1 ERB6]